MRLILGQRLGRDYDQGTIFDILQQVEQQVNDLADGRISARDGAATAAPTAGNYVKGDIVWDSAPTKTNGSVRLGWVCTASGTPGTWEEIRTLVANFAPITNSLGADVALNNTANYFDGPSIAQGTSGTWLVFGTVTCQDTAGAARFDVKLYDGTTVIASAFSSSGGASFGLAITVSGYISAPAGNLRIAVKDATSTSGKILANATGNSKDSSITAIRIG